MRVFVGVAVVVLGVLAAEAARDVQERDLRMAMAYAHRGLSALQKGNVARAREDFDRALAKLPGLPDAHTGLGHLAMRERRFEDALREYRLAEEGWRSMTSLSLRLETQRYADSRNELERLRVLQRDLAQAASRAEARAETGGSANPGRYTREVMELDGRIRALEAMNAPVPKPSGEPPGISSFSKGTRCST